MLNSNISVGKLRNYVFTTLFAKWPLNILKIAILRMFSYINCQEV